MVRFPVLPVPAILLFLCTWLSACSEQQDSEVTTLRIAFAGSTETVRPGFVSSRYSSALVLATYDTLFEHRYLVRPLELTPLLAARLPEISADGRTITVTLVPDVRFTDDPVFPGGVGREVTAKDVAYSILRHFDRDEPARRSDLWRDLIVGIQDWNGDYDNPPAGIRVVDDTTIRFQLTGRSPRFLHTLATAASAIVPREAEHAYGAQLSRRSVGSGPYRLASLDESGAVLVKNPNYRPRRFSASASGFDPDHHDARIADLDGRALPLTDRVEVSFAGDMTSRWLAFQNNELDIVPLNEPALSSLLQPNSAADLLPQYAARFRLHVSTGNEVILMRVKMDDETLGFPGEPEKNRRNKTLRCLVRDAVDWSERNRAFFEGRALEFQGMIAPSLNEFQMETRNRLTKAAVSRALRGLRESGGLPELTYGFTSNAKNQQNFEMFRSQVSAAGYPANLVRAVRYSSFGEFLNGTRDGRHVLSNISWTLDYPDAENNLQLFYGPNSSPGVNLGNYRNARYDELYEEVRSTEPSPTRTRLIDDMNDLLWDDCAYFGSLSPRSLILSQNDVVGLPDNASTMVGRYFAFMGKESGAGD